MKVRFDIEITRETVQLINDDPSTGKIKVIQQRVGVLLNCLEAGTGPNFLPVLRCAWRLF